jgi:hypothetical protein
VWRIASVLLVVMWKWRIKGGRRKGGKKNVEEITITVEG